MKMRWRILVAIAQVGEAYIHPKQFLKRRRHRKATDRIVHMSHEQFAEYLRVTGIASHLEDILRLKRKMAGKSDEYPVAK